MKARTRHRAMEAAGDDDPKLRVILDRLRRDGWADARLHPVQPVSRHGALARRAPRRAFPTTPVAIYGGQGNSFLLEGDRRRGASREEIQGLVWDRSLGLLVATDAASEGLNLQRLETLINVDLPWNSRTVGAAQGPDRPNRSARSRDRCSEPALPRLGRGSRSTARSRPDWSKSATCSARSRTRLRTLGSRPRSARSTKLGDGSRRCLRATRSKSAMRRTCR